eukprot:GFUD01140243.1.p1 GENE.GFUD01140243.1~~GFUD01140243.1.p1  ORF type:complete len:179 (-),score=36.90 GFUD01140243.1:7-543(-)
MTITEYKAEFNQYQFDLEEKILHKCGLCGEFLLLDSDCIATHLKGNHHSMTHHDYNARFMSLMWTINETKMKKKGKKLKGSMEAPIEQTEGPGGYLGDENAEYSQLKPQLLLKNANSKAKFPQTFLEASSISENAFSTEVRVEGFQNFLSKLSLPKYPALEAIMGLKNMNKENILESC